MWRSRFCLYLLISLTLPILGNFLLSALSGQTVYAKTGGTIAYGATVQGDVQDTYGEEWTFLGRAGEVVTITMSSKVFDTYLELYGPVHRRWYGRNNDGETIGTNSQIARYRLPDTGAFVIVAAGRTGRDKGTYMLSLDSPTTASSRPLCQVIVSYLNLRSGPGMDYSPPLRALPRHTLFKAQSRNQASTWIEVQLEGSPDRGWISANSRYVACNGDINRLPLQEGVAPLVVPMT